MFISKCKLKTRKIMIPFPFPAIPQIVSVYQGKYQKKEENNKKKE